MVLKFMNDYIRYHKSTYVENPNNIFKYHVTWCRNTQTNTDITSLYIKVLSS